MMDKPYALAFHFNKIIEALVYISAYLVDTNNMDSVLDAVRLKHV